MGNCEKCGRSIEEGAVFCSNCSRSLKTEVGVEMGLKTVKTDIDHEIFTFKRKYKSKWVSLLNTFPLFIAVLAIILGIAAVFSDNIELDISTYILPLGFSIVGLIIVFILSQRSKQNNFLFLALYILILTLSIAMIYPDEADIIVQVGIMLIGLILTFHISRRASRSYSLSLGIITIILSLGGALIFADISNIILGAGLAITGLLVISSKFL